MKICPVCHCAAFDDAEVCYGCLYPFESEEPGELSSAKQNRDGKIPPRFVVSLVPALEEGRVTWSCSVEQVADA